MLRRAVLLLPILFSIPAANALDANYENCLKKTSSRGDVDGFRSCVISHINKGNTNRVLPNGLILKNISHSNGFLIKNLKIEGIKYEKGDPDSERAKASFIESVESTNERAIQIHAYCVTLAKEYRKIFNDGTMIRYYDQRDRVIYTSYVKSRECNP
ncbi:MULTISPECIES: hypothetical protein [Klebsiella]|uniref:hypothetical protein n=1 Tax=Klebsiella TaxID=570 RepID=UPI0012B9FFB5|nr:MULTISPECIES: hypothetical protein [Klebsiella]ELK6574889.1 hypothetical protein [Klebsiella michiganensis]MDK9842004.1 hypothetical protein [Klebsiella michiganensis]